MAQPKKPASKKKTGSRRGGSRRQSRAREKAKKAEEDAPPEAEAVDPFAPTQRAPAPAPEKNHYLRRGTARLGAQEKKKEKKKRSRSRSRGRRRGRDDRRRQHRENDARELRQAVERFVSSYRLDPMAAQRMRGLSKPAQRCVLREGPLDGRNVSAVLMSRIGRLPDTKTLKRDFPTPSPSRSRGRRSRSSSSSSRILVVLSIAVSVALAVAVQVQEEGRLGRQEEGRQEEEAVPLALPR